ncbi:unnamed protein product, partial [Hapterophycus canaliculatus]
MMILMHDDDDEEPVPRGVLVQRERPSWFDYVRPMVLDSSFRRRFRMDFTDFSALADLLHPRLEKDERVGSLRNGAVPVEFQLAMALRFFAGGGVFDVMGSHAIAKSTAYAIIHRVIDAINQTPDLDCLWPEGGEVSLQNDLYRKRSTNGVIRRCVGAMDGLFVRMDQSSLRGHSNPAAFSGGHKKGFGMNLQVTREKCQVCDLVSPTLAKRLRAGPAP